MKWTCILTGKPTDPPTDPLTEDQIKKELEYRPPKEIEEKILIEQGEEDPLLDMQNEAEDADNKEDYSWSDLYPSIEEIYG